MEHQVALQSPEERAVHRSHCADVQRRLEETCGDVCVVQHYTQVTQRWLRASGVRALLLGGNVTDWAEYGEVDLLKMYRIIRSAEWPILGLCGGLQLIAMAHGAPLGPMRRLAEGEQDPNAGYGPGYFKEWGFVPVRVLKPDPLFEGLGEEPVFLAAHYWEVKETPPGFELLASSDVCRVQAIRQVGKSVYGTQFHPEAYVEGEHDRRGWLIDLVYPEGYLGEQTDGRRLLANFLKAAGIQPCEG
jgi:GMP synthase-like glutamine amidotransferase